MNFKTCWFLFNLLHYVQETFFLTVDKLNKSDFKIVNMLS